MDLENWTIEFLKQELEKRNLPGSGKKEELISKLLQSGYSSQSPCFDKWSIASLKTELRRLNLSAFGPRESLITTLTRQNQAQFQTSKMENILKLVCISTLLQGASFDKQISIF